MLKATGVSAFSPGGRRAGRQRPERIAEPLFPFLTRIGVEKAQIFVDRARNDVEIEPLGRHRLLEHEQRKALWARIGQPFLDGQSIALRLGNLLALVVEEELVIETFRRL